jgi:hypothetical protein
MMKTFALSFLEDLRLLKLRIHRSENPEQDLARIFMNRYLRDDLENETLIEKSNQYAWRADALYVDSASPMRHVAREYRSKAREIQRQYYQFDETGLEMSISILRDKSADFGMNPDVTEEAFRTMLLKNAPERVVNRLTAEIVEDDSNQARERPSA